MAPPVSALIIRQVSPPSSERHSSPGTVSRPFAVSISAYILFGFDGAIATAILPTPTSCFGSPFVSRFHVVPPSRDRNRPLPGPPLSGPHGFNWSCHIPARRIRGFFGFSATSEQPVFSSTKRTRSHVL